jgi:hypothetical protein
MRRYADVEIARAQLLKKYPRLYSLTQIEFLTERKLGIRSEFFGVGIGAEEGV